MILNRLSFFSILLGIIAFPFLLHKFIWLAGSEKTTGTMGFVGQSQTGQLVHNYAVVIFKIGNDTVGFNGNDNILFNKGEAVPVRYQRDNPKEARIDVFAAIWGDTLVYGGIPVLILVLVFLDPKIIPMKAKVKITARKPFIRILS